ncbi:MAG: recombinase family protein [Lachnospiraceae bacterium]|nr:recombinase family protein [Lachnospiraceae bacterium]
MENEWKIAIYLRLSKEDGDKDESDSISSQRLLISSFIERDMPDGEIIGEFIDDGYTGTNFKRPKFQEMIGLIDEGKVNCVIVKDLSRFGRDYIGVGEYLEKFFPIKDVRFIAVNDGYDTLSGNSNDDFIMPIKNIFNAQYSKDISKKVKSSFRSLQGEGKFVGAFASYGYVKNPKDRHELLVDEPAAKIVREIFDMYNGGMGKVSIARRLNERDVPCPSEYKRLNGLNYNNGQRAELTKYWTYSTINNILNNEIYIGNMVQNRKIRKTVRGRAKKNEKENWIIVSGTHEPIISEKTWNIAQNLLKRNTRQLDFEQNVGLFAGYIFCGNCGRAMSKIKNKYKSKTVTTYICGSYKRYGERICRRNAVKLELLEQLVLDKLNEQIKKAGEIEYDEDKSVKNREVDIRKYEITIEKCRRMKKSLYEDFKEGILTREEYFQYKSDYEKEEELAAGQINAILESGQGEEEERNRWMEILLKHRNIATLDRETVAEVLDKIVVTGGDDGLEIDIVFKFTLL